MANVKTVVDKDGDVWTGKVVDKSPSLGEVAVSALFLGIPLVPELAKRSDTTVRVNGQEHTGKPVDK